MEATLVVQSYGGEQEYKRGVFCVLSFFAHHSRARGLDVLLFTDRPNFFQPFLVGLPVTYIPLTAERIREMRGEIDFVHRVKICVIDEALALTEKKLLYVDSDTVCIDDGSGAIKDVSFGNVLMHNFEYRFNQMLDFVLPAGRPLHEFFHFAISREFVLSDGSYFRLDPQQVSWNAGTIVITSAHKPLLKDVFLLTDQFYNGTKHHGCEQYAFDIIFSKHATISSAEDFVFHYWPAVQKRIVDEFLRKKISLTWASRPLDEKLKDAYDWSSILPEFVKNHTLMLRHNAIQAFHNNDFVAGWRWACMAIMKAPFHITFIRDLIYHLKRNFFELFFPARTTPGQ